MSPLTIDEGARPAGLGDLPDLLALAGVARDELVPTRGGPLFFDREARVAGEDSLRAALDDPQQDVVVGTIDGVVVGFGTVRIERVRNGGRLGVIDDLFVLAEARGVGVGEAMMDRLLAFCTAQGCLGVDAVALPGNRATKNFFETFGLVARAILVHRALTPGSPTNPTD